ncbi:MAG: acyltransferase family protein [Acidaminococcus intestini]
MAKAVAIILVIIGHTVKYGSDIRNIIFSFHMPLFFLLSGYTYKMANTATDLYSHIRKGCRHLLLPCIIVSIIGIFASFILGDGNGIQQLWETVKRTGDALWWASGVKVHSHPGAGAIWFLFSLFWAKTIIDGLNLMFPGKHMGYILTFVGLMGIAIGSKGKWLPQNMDVTLVVILFIYLGMLWKKYQESIEKYAIPLFFLSILIWVSCLHYHIYIEMATRHYPFLTLSILEAVCGSFAICSLCKALAQNTFIRRLTLFIGAHTLLIFLVHHLDWIFRPLWQMPSYWMTCVMRVCSVLMISLCIHVIRCCVIKFPRQVNL